MISPPALSLEKRLFLFATPGIILAVALVVLGLLATINGKLAVERSAQAQAEFITSSQDSLNEWRDAMVKIEDTGEAESVFDARPMNIRDLFFFAPLKGDVTASFDSKEKHYAVC